MTTTPWPKAIGLLKSSALPLVSSASVRCVVCTVPWAPCFRFTGVHALCVVVYVRRPGPLGSCSPVRVLAVCSSHASYPLPSSSLVPVHALLDCCFFQPPSSCPRGAPGFRIRVSVCASPLFRPPLLLFPLAPVLLVLPPLLCLLLPPLAAIVSPPLWSFRSGLHVPMRPCAHPPPRLLLLPSCSFSSRFASSLLLVLPPSVPCSCSCSPLCVAPPPSPSPCLLPRTFHSRAASSPVVQVRAHCVPGSSSSLHPRTFSRIPSAAPDPPVHVTGFTPGRSSPGARAALHSAPDAPIRCVFLSYSSRCLGRSFPWHRVLPWTIQSGG